MRRIAHWLEQYDPAESTDILRELALSHALLGGKQGQHIASLIRRQRFAELCEYEMDYNSPHESAATLYNCRQAIAFFSKIEHLDIGVDKEKAAWGKFLTSEAACKETNEVFRQWSRGGFQFPPRVESWFFKAQRQIATVLGPFPGFDRLGYRFGKGATTLTKRRQASVREKFRAGATCSEELFPSAKALLGELPLLCQSWASALSIDDEEQWASVPITICDGRLDFVPKNAKTYRSTVTEPVLNGLYQLALGDYMFARLAAFGLDLRDQTKNQTLAREGSLTGALATLDLSSASDTISTELVFSLLPLEWAVGLARGRSGHVTYKGERLTLEKFSSMGNGYTFPLESLIFWALTRAVCSADEVVSVYGDDIICPTHRYHEVCEVLRAAGFTVNESKSFHNGPFRESCGRDFYQGIDIRPYFQKDWVSPRSLFVLHNFYARRANTEMAERVMRLIHPDLRIGGPDGYGDGHLLMDFTPTRKARHSAAGFAGYTFDTFSVKAAKDTRPPLPGDFVYPAYSIYRRNSEELLADPVQIVLASKSRSLQPVHGEALRFVGAYSRGHGTLGSTLPISDVRVGDDWIKAAPLPETLDEYKRISIYTLGH